MMTHMAPWLSWETETTTGALTVAALLISERGRELGSSEDVGH